MFRFPLFFSNFLFLFQDTTLLLIIISPEASLDYDSFRFSFCWSWEFWVSVRYFTECPSTGIYLFFSWLNWGYGFGEDLKDVILTTSHQGYILRIWLITLTLISLRRSCSSVFFNVKLHFFPFPYSPLWKEVTVCSPHLRSKEGIMIHLTEDGVST